MGSYHRFLSRDANLPTTNLFDGIDGNVEDEMGDGGQG